MEKILWLNDSAPDHSKAPTVKGNFLFTLYSLTHPFCRPWKNANLVLMYNFNASAARL